MERLSGEIRDRENVMRGLKRTDTAVVSGSKRSLYGPLLTTIVVPITESVLAILIIPEKRGEGLNVNINNPITIAFFI
jgi:hypothetical protein